VRSATRRFAIAALLFACCLAAPAQRSSARKGVNKMGAPIPDPILNGKKVFISFELGDTVDFDGVYSGGPERAYSEFHNQMKQWNHYELVSNPNDADMVFAIRFTGVLRLTLLDARGRISLWGFVEQVDPAFFKKHRDNQFSQSVSRLIADLKTLLDEATASTSPATP
jgi:hypothetical protein